MKNIEAQDAIGDFERTAYPLLLTACFLAEALENDDDIKTDLGWRRYMVDTVDSAPPAATTLVHLLSEFNRQFVEWKVKLEALLDGKEAS